MKTQEVQNFLDIIEWHLEDIMPRIKANEKITTRLLTSIITAAQHPETPEVVRAMLVHAIKDCRALAEEMNS